ncbi:MAG: hypothetical protein DKINENOH_00906 [bacterium]|nr:hypothetical protein [bacterium]
MRYPLLILCSSISTSLPFLAWATLIRRHTRPANGLQFLWAFFASATLAEIILLILSAQGIKSAWFFHVYTLVEYVLLALIITNWQTDATVARLMRASIPVYLFCFILVKLAGLESLEPGSYNNLTRPLAVLLLSTFSFLTLQALWRQTPANLTGDYRFWMLLAMLLYYSTSLVLSAFMFTKNHDLLKGLFETHAVINIIRNLLFTIGVFQLRKAQQTALQ